jgi:hypothetical protein
MKYYNAHDIFAYFIEQPREMLRKKCIEVNPEQNQEKQKKVLLQGATFFFFTLITLLCT